MKKVLVSVLLVVLLCVSAFSAIVDYVPADASFALVMRNNASQYEQLKKVGIFGFLLRDMGLESMIAQQFESMKYTDPSFKPENFWGLLGGDIAAFSQGEFDFSVFGDLFGFASDPDDLLPEMMDRLQDLSMVFIIKPTADPDLVIKTWNKALGMEMAWGVDPYSGMMLEKSDGYILFGTNAQAIAAAKGAKTNNILNNPHFRKEYDAGHWMVLYSKSQMETESVSDLLESNLGLKIPTDILEGVETDYSIATLRVGEALELRQVTYFIYSSDSLKRFVIDANADLADLYKKTSIPGTIQGLMAVNKIEEVWKNVEPVFNDIINQLIEKGEMDETDKSTAEKVFGFIKGFKGLMKFGMDITLDESLNPLVDLFLKIDMDKMADLQDWARKQSETAFVAKDGYLESVIMAKNKGDDFDFNLYLGQDEIILSTLKAKQLKSVDSLPVLAKNLMFAELSNRYSFKKGNAMVFADIGSILTKILGVAYPSGLFLEFGADENANVRMIAVIK